MHRKYTVLYVLGACVTLCAGVMLRFDALGCAWVSWCGDARSGRALLLSTLGLPLVIAVGRALYAGIVQILRTRQLIRRLRMLPHRSLTPGQHALAQSLGLQKRIDVVTTSDSYAWCYGLLRPRIYVTTGLLDALTSDELEAVLRHERYHLQRYDPLRTLFWTMCTAAGWGAEEQRQAHVQRELAADREVVVAGQRQALASALLKLLTHQGKPQHNTTNLAISGISVTEARIEQLLQGEMLLVAPVPLYCRWYVAPAAWSTMLLLCLAIVM